MKTQASYVDWDFDTVWIMNEFPEFIKGAGIPKLTANNSQIISEGDWYDNGLASMWSPTGVIWNYYAFDKNLDTFTATTSTDLNAIGCSIGYDFGKPVRVYRASGKIQMLGYKIQASNDNKNWEDIIVAKNSEKVQFYSFSDKITTNEKYRYW